jgi:hypothetical protein
VNGSVLSPAPAKSKRMLAMPTSAKASATRARPPFSLRPPPCPWWITTSGSRSCFFPTGVTTVAGISMPREAIWSSTDSKS